MTNVEAFLLIQTDVGSERSVYGRLADLDEINSVYELFGEWDIIAKIGVESIGALDGFISDTIRHIDGVNLTSTIIVSR
mgnify:CR=1 FL=1